MVALVHRYDDLRNYSNERSVYLAQLRDSIEAPWQQWELGHFDVESYKSKTVEQVFSGWSRNSQGSYVVSAHVRQALTCSSLFFLCIIISSLLVCIAVSLVCSHSCVQSKIVYSPKQQACSQDLYSTEQQARSQGLCSSQELQLACEQKSCSDCFNVRPSDAAQLGCLQPCGRGMQLKDMVRQQAAHDVDPPLSEAASYIKNDMSKEGYRHLLAVGMPLTTVCRCSVGQGSCFAPACFHQQNTVSLSKQTVTTVAEAPCFAVRPATC